MKKVVDYLLSVIFLLYFGLLLVVFHVLQVLAFTIFGRKAHKWVVDALNFFIVYGWFLTGTRAKFISKTILPDNQPIIFVANHQSMFDIPGIIWFLRKYTPTFVSKIELAKGIPSISYNLRKSGAALIDRKDGKKAVVEIAKLGKFISDNAISAVIFPEGTRSRTGVMKPFAVAGLATLYKRSPKALIVPIAIKGTGYFNPTGLFPLRSFSTISFTVLPPINTTDRAIEEVILECQEAIQAALATS